MRKFFLLLIPLLLSQYTFAALCENTSTFNPAANDSWTGWGSNYFNTRLNNADSNPVNASQLDKLKLKWAFAFPDVRSVIGNPSIAGDRIFIGTETGEVYSMDVESGCVYWVFQADNGVRTTPLIEYVNDKWTVFFGDRSANVYGIDANTGSQLWKVKVEEHGAAILTGAPQFVHLENEIVPDRLIIPVSSSEEGMAAAPTYACCSFRGSVVSLNANNGQQLWKTYTIENEAVETEAGTFGPSGAAIWSAPTVDLALNRLYVTTGDAYSAPAGKATDAVIAMDLVDGTIAWIFQGTADDIWTVVCMTPNAAENCGPDQDFGSPAMLVSNGDRQFLISGQKSSIVRAHDRNTGEVFWQTALAENTTEFGGKIIWGGASDLNSAYFGMGTGVIAAVDLDGGAIKWSTELTTATGRESHPGQDGPVTVSHDVLFSGGWDGILRALSTATGEVIWEYDTAREFETVNDLPGNGGSMGAVGQIVEDGYLLVPSGYVGVKNGMPGNVLLVFTIDEN